MTDTTFLRRIRQIDLSAFEARKAELDGELQTLDEALARGDARAHELRLMLGELREEKHAGSKAADALLKGEDLMQIDADEEKAKSELAIISLGRKELVNRQDAVKRAMGELKREVSAALGPIVDAQVEELQAQVREHALALASIFASSQALSVSLANLRATGLANSLKEVLPIFVREQMAPKTISTPAALKEGLDSLPAVQLLGRS